MAGRDDSPGSTSVHEDVVPNDVNGMCVRVLVCMCVLVNLHRYRQHNHIHSDVSVRVAMWMCVLVNWLSVTFRMCICS